MSSAIHIAALVVFTALLLPETTFAQRRDREVITRAEIDSSSHRERDSYEAIRSLRPHYLRPPRGVRSLGNGAMDPIVVYINGSKASGLDALRMIMAREVDEIRYLDASASQNEYHTNGGAIVVRLRGAPGERASPPADASTPPR